jgi:hypothetical protein
MICPTCKGNGFVWVEAPEPKKDRWAADCTACKNQGEMTAKKNETLLYYKGFFAEDAFYNPEMKEFSKHLDFEKKSNSFILYQNKIKKGSERKDDPPIYVYYIKKLDINKFK